MTPVLAPPPSRPPLDAESCFVLSDVEQGVIEEARRRQRRRRLGIALSLAVLAALAAGFLLASGSSSGKTAAAARAPRGPKRGLGAATSRSPARRSVRLVPALEGGAVGWETMIFHQDGSSGASCCGLITHEAQTQDASKGSHSKGLWADTVITAPNAAFVSVGGHKPVPTRSGGLPYGLRFAIVRVRHIYSKPVAFNARHELIDVRGFRSMPKRHEFEGPYAPKRWQSPAAPPPGACQISASGLPGLAAQYGANISRIKGYRSIGGPAFQSCANTVYKLAGNVLNASVLLDAEHPGTKPAALPGMHAITGSPGFYEAPGGAGIIDPSLFDHKRRSRSAIPKSSALTAVRIKGAWLVAIGASRGRRITLLRHLHATIHV